MIRYPEKRVAPAGEALKHFIFVAPEGAVVEEEKKETESLMDVPIVLTVKVPGQKAGLDRVWRVGEMEKEGCRTGMSRGQSHFSLRFLPWCQGVGGASHPHQRPVKEREG